MAGACQALAGQLGQPVATQPGQVHHGSHGAQGLVGADVRGRALAADVLLTGAEGHHVSAAALLVDRLAHHTARQAAHLIVGAGEKAERRPAVGEPLAERLPLPHHQVGALRAGGCDQPDGGRLQLHDQLCAGGARRVGPGPDVLDDPERVRLGDHHGSDVVVDRDDGGAAGLRVGGQHIDDPAHRMAVGAHHRPAGRVQRGGDEHAVAARGRAGHRHRLGHRGAAVVEAGVGDRQTGQLRHQRLVLEQRLEHPLADLGLVRRVGREQLAARDHRADHRGHVVVVGAAAGEARRRGVVAVRERRQVADGLVLAAAVGQVQPAREPQVGGDVLEQLVQVAQADGLEHRGEVFLCVRSEVQVLLAPPGVRQPVAGILPGRPARRTGGWARSAGRAVISASTSS